MPSPATRRLHFTLGVALLFLGCNRQTPAPKEATIAQTAEYVKNGGATILDANDDEYRKAVGVIPGAVLLTSFSSYALTQLPEDKARPLVFYCTSRM